MTSTNNNKPVRKLKNINQFVDRVRDFIELQRPKTMQDINIWKNCYTLADEERNIEDIPPHVAFFYGNKEKR